MSNRRISLLTMGQGNVLALKQTLESFKGVVDEVIYGDMLLFPEDRLVLESYKKEYNINIQRLPFNYLFQMGFSSCLNFLTSNAKNDIVIYMNTSEAIDEDYGIVDIVNDNVDCNMFYFTHRTDPHRWFRCYNRKELQWKGFIHEEVVPIIGEEKPYHKPIFMMKDEEKDMQDPYKALIFNLFKEQTYFRNYMKIVDYPKLFEGTNEGWKSFALDQYPSMKERIEKYEKFHLAVKTGNYDMLMEDILNNPSFEKERLESSKLINFQGIRKDIL